MKNYYLLMISCLLLSAALYGQTPQAINYQGVARDNNGNVIANDTIALKLTILAGSSSGSPVYVETHRKKTDDFGLFTLQIGFGSIVSGTFSAISWSANSYYLKVEIDPLGGTAWQSAGTSQFFSVPYALYSKTAENYTETDPIWTTVSGNYYTKTNMQTSGASALHFNNLTNKPTTVAGYGITDAMTTAHPANAITNTNIANWNAAFGWGNHAGLYRPISYVPAWGEITSNPFSFTSVVNNQLIKYNSTSGKWENWTSNFLTSYTETDPIWTAATGNYYTKTNMQTSGTSALHFNNLTNKPTTVAGYGITDAMTTAHPANAITNTNIANWNTAFGWGNHAGLYRLISYVPAWGEITSNPFLFTSVSNNQLIKYNSTSGKWENWTSNFLTSYTETDPIWTAAIGNYYTITNLQISGASAVHFNNLTNVPVASTSQYGIVQLSISYGGSSTTLATTELALTNGLATKANSSHFHDATNITTGTLALARGGTGVSSYATNGGLLYYSSSTPNSLVQASIGTSAQVLIGGSTTPQWGQVNLTSQVTNTLPAASGGTGWPSYAIGDMLYASTTTALAKLTASGATNRVLLSGTGTTPAWGQVPLTTHVSGILPIANGGTNNNSAIGSPGSIVYSNGTQYVFSGVGTTGQAMVSGGSGSPTWFAPTANSVIFAGASGILSQDATNFSWSNGLTSKSSSSAVIGYGNGASTAPLYTGGGAFIGTAIGVFGQATSSSGERAGGFFRTDGSAYARVGGYNSAGAAKLIWGVGTVASSIQSQDGMVADLSVALLPETVVTDYGVGKLENGKCSIKIDPVVAKRIYVSDEYPMKVFIQLEGDCNGVYVTNKSANGFDVIELMAGKSDVPFSWTFTANLNDIFAPDGSVVSRNLGLRAKEYINTAIR